jgi:hypothetical protein
MIRQNNGNSSGRIDVSDDMSIRNILTEIDRSIIIKDVKPVQHPSVSHNF